MNAVIYCRVSSKEQIEGTSLETQEQLCREYARRQNMAAIRVFVEEGESAKFADRPALLELLQYCRDKRRGIGVLLVWKIDRFARNVEDHYAVKAALKKLGVQIVSVTEPIQADPNGKLLETILAGFAQFDNDIRALRSVQGMQQRLREGIWPWMPPLGYLPPRIGKKTQPDEPDPRCFEQLKKAWQMYATGAYAKADILRLLRTWGVRAQRGRLVTAQRLDHMFANPFYAGIVRDPWTGAEYSGRHVPMVGTEEFARVQETTRNRSNSQPHHRLSEAFPLRGLVRCPTCQARMTGYFAAGRSRPYPYYKCFNRGCATWSKSYPAAEAHEELTRHLADTSIPNELASEIVSALIRTYWEQAEEADRAAIKRRDEVARLNRQLRELVSIRTSSLIDDDEFVAQRRTLKSKLFELQASHVEEPSLTPADVASLTGALGDLSATWWGLSREAKQGFGRLLFPAGYSFRRVRTAKKGLLFKTFGASKEGLVSYVPLIRKNLNALMADIRKLLALCRTSEESKSKAA